jgi:hypothetical protein
MRIVATAIVIAIAATSAGCSGSSSSSSRAPAQTVTQTTAAPTKAAAGPTKATSGSGRGAKALPAHLAGRPLDVAEGMLHRSGISYKVIPLHGRVNDAATRWGVCETMPVANRPESSPVVDLIVAQLKCGGR